MNGKIATIGFFAADVALIAASVFLYLKLDKTAPVISFADDEKKLVYTAGMSEEKLLEGVSALDDADGDVTGSLLVEKISETADGKVIVTYVALDSANNVGKRSRIYEVK